MRFDITDLRLFLCIADEGSITRGARRANLALASASERLHRMETNAAVKLVQRLPRGIALTEAGSMLARHARCLLDQHSLLQCEMREFATGSRGSLRLYANTAALTQFLPARLSPWLVVRPNVALDLEELESSEIIHRIEAEAGEAGIVTDVVDPRSLQLHPVAQSTLVLIVPARHPIAQRRRVFLVETLAEPFVTLLPGSALQVHLNSHATAAGHTLTARVQTRTFEGICEMVGNGVGLGIVPSEIAKRLHRRYRYRIVALNDHWSRRNLCLCFKRWDHLSPAMRSLMHHLGAPSEPQLDAQSR